MYILFFIVLIDLIGFGVVIPLLPFYGVHFGANPAEVTWMMGCYSLAQFFFSPLLGRLSDRWGRRPVLLVSLAFSVASRWRDQGLGSRRDRCGAIALSRRPPCGEHGAIAAPAKQFHPLATGRRLHRRGDDRSEARFRRALRPRLSARHRRVSSELPRI